MSVQSANLSQAACARVSRLPEFSVGGAAAERRDSPDTLVKAIVSVRYACSIETVLYSISGFRRKTLKIAGLIANENVPAR